MTSNAARARIACALLSLLGCEAEVRQIPATQVIARIEAAPRVRAASDAIRVRLAAPNRQAESRVWSEQSARLYPLTAAQGWPMEVRIRPETGTPEDGLFEVIVDALAGDKVIAQQRAIVGFRPHRVGQLTIELDACGKLQLGELCESDALGCYGNACLTCDEGECRPTPVSEFEAYEADAGMAQPPGPKPTPLDAGQDGEAGRPPELDASDARALALPEASSGEREAGAPAPEPVLPMPPREAGVPVVMPPPEPTDCGLQPDPHAYCASRAALGLSAKCMAGSCVEVCADPDAELVAGACKKRNDCAGVSACGAGTCVDGVRAFTCNCPPNELGTGTQACGPNPCAGDLATLCGAGASSCENGAGRYSCKCAPGYHVVPGSPQCVDLDECVTARGGCADACDNEIGSFSCRCEGDRVLAADGRSCAEPAWGALSLLSSAGAAYSPEVAMSRTGALAVWRQNVPTPRAQASRYQAGAWSVPSTLAGSEGTLFAQVALARSGSATITTQHYVVGTGYFLGGARNNDQGWGAWRQIDSLGGPGWTDTVALAGHEDGRAYLLWGRGEGQAVQIAKLLPDGTWGMPVAFAAASGGARRSHGELAVAANGRAVAIWNQVSPSLIGGPDLSQAFYSLHAQQANPPVALGMPVASERFGGGVAVTADAAQQFHLFWQEGGALRYARLGTADVLSDMGEVPSPSALPLDSASYLAASSGGGRVSIAWTLGPDRKVGVVNRWAPGTGWSMPIVLGEALADVPQVAMTPGGSTLIVYLEQVGELRYLRARRLRIDGSLEPPIALNEGVGPGRNMQFDLAMDPLGRALVVWNEADAQAMGSSIFARRFE